MRIRKTCIAVVSFTLLAFAFQSCSTYKNVPYFMDFADTAKPTLAKTAPFSNPLIQPNDILSITIQTIDNDITNLLNSNTPVNGAVANVPVAPVSGSASAAQPTNGYMVDKDGNIELPFAGKVKVSGLSTTQAKEVVKTAVDKYFNNAIVNLRFTNFKITVLGEVAKPSSYIVPNEKINILDALGMAGDLTIYGRRENILLIRDSAGDKKMIRMSLNSKDIISSPYFYLQPNDIVYVEPNKNKIAGSDAVRNRNITIVASALSVLIVVFSRVR